MRRSRRIVGIRLARRRRRTRPPRRGGESVSDGGQPGAPFGSIRVLLRHKGADSEPALQSGRRDRPTLDIDDEHLRAGAPPGRLRRRKSRRRVTRCRSSPAASSGVHRVPDPARDCRYAAMTAGAEREDAPSRTGHITHRAGAQPSRTRSPHAPAVPAAEPYAARHDPDGHEPIEGWRILLQHHDIVTGEAIVAGNVLEERDRAARRSATRPAPSRTTSSERSRRGCPAPNRAPCRERGGTPADGRRQEAHTAARRYNAGERAHGGAHPSKIRADAPFARTEQQPWWPPSGTPLGRPRRAAR